jgi:hypothetical protein
LGVTEDEIEKVDFNAGRSEELSSFNVGPINSIVRMRLAIELAVQGREDAPLAIRSLAFQSISCLI